MNHLQDEHIECASCGTAFLFSAGEAAVFAERGLTAPKRCKECRRARKEQGGFGRQGGDASRGDQRGARPAPRFDGGARGPRPYGGNGPRTPRYTGDVNEYRSPMQDTAAATPWTGQVEGNTRPRRPAFRDDGNYRAPSSQGNGGGFARDGRRPPHQNGQNGFGRARPPGQAEGAAQGGKAPSKRRPAGEMFSITCNSCGAQAEVPFKPADGRDVFCQSCYRARKPS